MTVNLGFLSVSWAAVSHKSDKQDLQILSPSPLHSAPTSTIDICYGKIGIGGGGGGDEG